MAEVAHAAARLMPAGWQTRERRRVGGNALLAFGRESVPKAIERAAAISQESGIQSWSGKKGLIAVSEGIKCWSMKLHRPRWSRVV